jgi:hypothetical protein
MSTDVSEEHVTFIFRVEEEAEKETSVKRGKQSNRLAGISDYMGNRREMEEWNSVPLGLPVGQNETTNTHWLS